IDHRQLGRVGPGQLDRAVGIGGSGHLVAALDEGPGHAAAEHVVVVDQQDRGAAGAVLGHRPLIPPAGQVWRRAAGRTAPPGARRARASTSTGTVTVTRVPRPAAVSINIAPPMLSNTARAR